jgi:hypothetical protein
MNGRIDAERILDAYLAPEADRLPDRVLDAALADIARTPQRRALRVPWRFRFMPALTRTTAIAAVALAVAVGAGGMIYINSTRPGDVGGPATPSPTIATTPAPTLTPSGSQVARGIASWRTHTSDVHGLTISYPDDWSVFESATRKWQSGDTPFGDLRPFTDTFVSPGAGDAQIAMFAWNMEAGEGIDLDSVADLKTWGETFCDDVGASSCEDFTQRAVPMCHDVGGDDCRAAILVPTAEGQWAFFGDWISMLFTGNPDLVTVVFISREDGFPPAARYGGSVELLKSILTTMDVRTPRPGRNPG